jgi:hypothetical protein
VLLPPDMSLSSILDVLLVLHRVVFWIVGQLSDDPERGTLVQTGVAYLSRDSRVSAAQTRQRSGGMRRGARRRGAGEVAWRGRGRSARCRVSRISKGPC